MRGHRAERGMATAELAVVIPAVLVVLALCLAGLGLAVDQVRCADAARVAARAASRGDAVGEARDAAARVAPEGSRIDIDVGGGEVVVEVTAPARKLLFGGPAARSRAAADLEPGAAPGGR